MRTTGSGNFKFLHTKVFPFLIRMLMQINLWLIIVRLGGEKKKKRREEKKKKIKGHKASKPGDNFTQPGIEPRPQ